MSARGSKFLLSEEQDRISNQGSRRATRQWLNRVSEKVLNQNSELEANYDPVKQQPEPMSMEEKQRKPLETFAENSTSQLKKEGSGRESSQGTDEDSQPGEDTETDQIEEFQSSADRKKTEITFHLPSSQQASPRGSNAIATTQPRITRMFHSININKKRRSTYIRPVLKFLPTYRLESQNPFNPRIVEEILARVIEGHMESRPKVRFTTNGSLLVCRSLSEEILSQVKAKNFDRFRIIVTVTVGEKLHQSFCQSVNYFWDAENDALANYVYERPEIFIITTVYGIYYD